MGNLQLVIGKESLPQLPKTASGFLAIANAIKLSEPADLLNQLKGRRKKSKVELADVDIILEILEGA